MNYETLEEVVCGRISDLVDQMLHHQNAGDEVMMSVLHQEILELKDYMKDEDYDFFYATDLRHIDK